MRACLWWKSLRWLAILRCRAATDSRLRSPGFVEPRLARCQPLLRRGQPACGGASPARIVDVLTVAEWWRNWTIPTSTPTWRPVFGSGLVGTSSHESTSIQRRPRRLIWIVFTRPCTERCKATLTWPTPCRYTRRCWGSQRAPSPSLGHSTRVEPGRALEPGVAGFLAALNPPEEPGERLIQGAQRGLLARKRPECLIWTRRPGSRSAAPTGPHS